MNSGRVHWQKVEETRKDFNIVLGCAFNLPSITNSGLIPGGQNLSKGKQTVFFTAANPMNKEHKDPYEIDLEAPASCLVSAESVEETSEYGVLGRHQSCSEDRSNAIILYDTLPAHCIPKVIMMESGEIIYERVYASPRPPPKISLKVKWMKELDSEVGWR